MEDSKPILHELYVYCEWKPEPEYVQSTDIVQENLIEFWKWLRYFGVKKSLIACISAFKEQHLKWHIALGQQGRLIAVLTDNILELRTKRSDFSTISARTTVPRDGYAQSRKLVWSPDCSFLVVAHGNGVVSFFDLALTNLYNIPMNCTKPGGLECTDNTHSLAEIIFKTPGNKNGKWCWEVLLLTHDGRLRSYLISKSEGYEFCHNFTFSGAVSAAAYNKDHEQIYIAGVPEPGYKDSSSPISAGLTAWRILKDEPYYKLSVVSDQYEAQLTKPFQFKIPFISNKNLAFIVNMSVSNEGTKLLCLHSNGTISCWSLPTLLQLWCWPLNSQQMNGERLRTSQTPLLQSQPAHHAWWGEEEIIISRFNGLVSVCQLKDMVNILGKKAEFLHGVPRVTKRVDGTFIALECEMLADKRRDGNSVDDKNNQENSPGVLAVLSGVKELVKSALFAVTDLETFRPKPKQITVVGKIYRLLGFRSTTPRELFNRKIAGGQYDEALSVADEYGLEKDFVYQERWRKTNVTADAIHNYLANVTNKIWVVHQCSDRLPETLAAAEELLNFGLKLTNKEIIDDINKSRDSEEKISDPHKITPEDLTSYTTELLQYRHSMLLYLHRLRLYKEILRTEKSNYLKEEYQCLRNSTATKCAQELAKEGRVAALSCVWPLLKSLHIRLLSLDSLPETINPMLYKHLLPKPINEDVADDATYTKSDEDWCQNVIFRNIVTLEEQSLETEELDTAGMNADIRTWYVTRARDMEMFSRQVSNALCLLSLAMNLGIDVKVPHFHMDTLATLVYEADQEDMTLDHLKIMSVMDVAMAMMNKSINTMNPEDVKTLLIPYLKNYAHVMQKNISYPSLIMEFMENISATNLNFTIAILHSVNLDISDIESASMITRCLAAYKGTQLDQVHSLAECFPGVPTKHRKDLKILIDTADILHKLDTPTSTYEIANLRKYKDVSRIHLLLNKVAERFVSPKYPDETSSKTRFTCLVKYLLDLGKNTFSNIISAETIYETIAKALLSSGDERLFPLLKEVMQTSPSEQPLQADQPLVPYEKACTLVLLAARQYFNSSGGSFMNKNISLARQCLQLMHEPPNADVSRELDLIDALPIIQSFKVQILPVQVRLCDERLRLIEMCLEADPNAINATPKLMKLATLLKHCDGDERQREADILMLVCRRALAAGPAGLDACAGAARRLCALRHAPAAPLLREVARAAVPLPFPERRALLAAAAAHANYGLPALLNERMQLEIEMLQGELCNQRNPNLSPPPYTTGNDSSGEEDGYRTPDKNVDVLTNFMMSFQSLFNNPDEVVTCSTRTHVQEFYRELYPSHAASDHHYDYTSCAAPPRPASARPALATLHLHNLQPLYSTLETSVLVKTFFEVIHSDTPLGVACALRLLRDSQIYKTQIQSQGSVTALSALLYAVLIRSLKHSMHEAAYLARPIEMARLCLNDEKIKVEYKEFIDLCLIRIEAITECNQITAVGAEVDKQRYTSDPLYAKQIILMMAQSGSPEQWQLAVKLADQRGVSSLQLWATRAAAAVLAGERPEHSMRVLTLHLGQEAEAITLLRNAVWDDIAGHEHDTLISYYLLVSKLDAKAEVDHMQATQHVRQLKKIKAVLPALDYKLLLKRESDELLQHVLLLMKADNVGMVMKLFRNMPAALRVLDPDTLLVKFLVKIFFNNTEVIDNERMVPLFEEVLSYFHKLPPQQCLNVVSELCFTPLGLERMQREPRALLIGLALDYCLRKHNDGQKIASGTCTWERASMTLQCWDGKVRQFLHPRVWALMNAVPLPQLWIELECSLGERDKLLPVLSKLVMEANIKPTELINLIEDLELNVSVDDVFWYILKSCDRESYAVTALSRLRHHRLLNTSVIELAQQLAEAHRLPPHLIAGLHALRLQEKLKRGLDMDVVLEYSIAVFRAEWPNLDLTTITVENLRSPQRRRSLFVSLLGATDSWPQRRALSDVLRFWPTNDRDDGSRSLQALLMSHILTDCRDHEEARYMLREMLEHITLSHTEVTALEEVARGEEERLTLLWIMMLTNTSAVRQCIPKYLHKINFDNLTISDEFVIEILDRGLMVASVGTSLYSTVAQFMLAPHANPQIVPLSAEMLKNAGYVAEAGALLIAGDQVPQGLRTFMESLLYIKRKL